MQFRVHRQTQLEINDERMHNYGDNGDDLVRLIYVSRLFVLFVVGVSKDRCTIKLLLTCYYSSVIKADQLYS